jgi:hypothetical protein
MKSMFDIAAETSASKKATGSGVCKKCNVKFAAL